jgi:hypothetical protein
MKRYAVCVDAGYLFAQGSVALTGAKQRREVLVLDPSKVIRELREIAASKIGTRRPLTPPANGMPRLSEHFFP